MDNKPNIVVIVPHDLGRHLHCYGVPAVQSPAIDRLAGEGVKFNQFFCAAPQCSPSRAALFTGRYPHSNGVMGLTHGWFGWGLDPGEVHLAQMLADAGYHTALIGETHEDCGHGRLGFAEVVSCKFGLAPEYAEHAEAFFAERAKHDEPFFLELNTMEPHRAEFGFFSGTPETENGVHIPPYIVDNIDAQEDFAGFQGSIHSLDTAVGHVIEALDASGLGENTLVVFTADHGIPFPRAKCSLHDPGLEVPLILRWPRASWSPGTEIDSMISNVSFVPTLLDLLGMETPAGVQGRSFAPLLRGEAYEPETAIFGEMTYHDYCDPRRCIRTHTHKLIVNFTCAPFYMDPSQSFRPKCITKHPRNPAHSYHEPVELYDLQTDPCEAQNVAADPDYSDVKAGLLNRLHDWMKETDDPLLRGIPVPPRMWNAAMAALRGD